MDWQRLLRNWFYPALAAALTALLDALMTGTDYKTALLAAGALLLTKLNPLSGDDQKWFSHDKGDGDSPHEE